MRRFDYSFLNTLPLPNYILAQLMDIEAYKAKGQRGQIEYGTVYGELTELSKLFSVESSLAIEGIATTPERFVELMQGKDKAQNHAEEEMLGYKQALAQVHEGRLSFGEPSIKHMHTLLMPEGKGGQYKTQNNLILATDAQGRRSVRFRPTPAEETPFAMEQWELATIAAIQEGIQPLLLIPCVVLDFLCIHPFLDGNGRVSRLLSLLLLNAQGYDIGNYISMEHEILKRREEYYKVLAESTQAWMEEKNDYLPFIHFSLGILLACYRELGKRFDSLSGKKRSKKSRVESALQDSPIALSKADLRKDMPDISESTIELVLAELLKQGKIEKMYAARATRYFWKGRR